MVIASALLGLLAGASSSPVTVADLVDVTEISGLSVSPDGATLAFRTEQASIADNGYRIQWWVIAADGRGAPRRLADGGEALFSDGGMVLPEKPIWAPDSQHLYFRALHHRDVQVWQASMDGTEAQQVTHDPGNLLDFRLNPDGRTLSYHVGASRSAIEAAERTAHDDGVLIDASVDIAQPISRGAWLDGALSSERLTGHWFAHGNILWNTPVRAVTIELPPSGDQTPRLASASYSATATIRWIHGDPALFATWADGREVRCDTVQCKAGRPVSAEMLRDHRTWLVTTADIAQDQTLSLWRPGERRARVLRVEPGQVSGDREKDTPCAVGVASIFCVEADTVSPPRLVSVDLGSRRLKALFDPNADLRRRIGNPVRTLQWSSADSTRFSAKLILPATPRPPAGYPLVMNYYDCPGFLRGGLGDELPMLPLATNGIAILCINRPHTISDDRDANSDYDRAVAGIKVIVDRLSREDVVDRRHIGMWGLSFGSEITMAILQRTDILSAASVSTGILEPGFYWFNGVAGRDTSAILSKAFGIGDPDLDDIGWKKVSPALHAQDIKAPLLMQLPEQEARWSMELYSKLTRTATPVEMYTFANERHIKQQPRHRDAVYRRNLDWFGYWLRGDRDPDPAKHAQYAGWDALSARWKAGVMIVDHSHP